MVLLWRVHIALGDLVRAGTPLAAAQDAFMLRVRQEVDKEGAAEAKAVAELRVAEDAEAERWRVEEVGKGLEESPSWG
ncbi:hypothetical protein R3P38DRAFT_3213992 [Favolaschia claudopus]|uniref:Uncharacterized protein n=1 Tax=Favolaschia claudopus TaxID=2862362 RepID=A0AAW0ACS6_9AGAR